MLVLEGAAEVGGKLRRAEVGGVPSTSARSRCSTGAPRGSTWPGSSAWTVVHPAVTRSSVWTRGELRPLPRSLMGVPLDLDELRSSGVLSDEGLARVADRAARA